MRTYFSPRILALVTLCAAIANMGLPLSAQNAQIHSNATQAGLRIEAIVVPAVALHRHHRDKDKDRDKDRDEAAVAYDFQTSLEEFSVTEEVRPMLVDATRHEQVRIITVVAK